MKLIWKIVITIIVIAITGIIIFVSIKYDPSKSNTYTQNSYSSNSSYDEYNLEINFSENVGKIIDDLEVSINNTTYNGDDIDLLINSERSFLSSLENLNTRLSNLTYPTSCSNYRNNLCDIFSEICVSERDLINSLEMADYDRYTNHFAKINNNFNSLIDTYNSMLSYLQNKYE